MKTFRFIAVSFIFAAVFAVSAFAQTPPTANVALVNTQAFYAESGGINKISGVYTKLEAEFKSVDTDLRTANTRMETLKKEIEAANTLIKNGGKVDENSVNAKVEEYQRLQVDMKRKQEDAKARFDKREAEMMNPVFLDISKSIEAYAKQKGFTLVLDASKMAQSGILLYSTATTDITADFIKFFNASPGGTATTQK